MADYALFLKCRFNPTDGNFLDNSRGNQRRPDNRFWSQVAGPPNNLVATGPRTNADTRTMEMIARSQTPTDRVYFAVLLVPGAGAPTLNSISFSCAINPIVRTNQARLASPFRLGNSLNGELQVSLKGNPNKTITVGSDAYQAAGPYDLIPDPNGQQYDSCFYKLTLTASVNGTVAGNAVTREFSYDPDMDIELEL